MTEADGAPADRLRQTGIRTYRDVMTSAPPELDDPLLAAQLEFVFGEVWNRPGLSRADRRWITLSCVAATASPASLSDHVYGALNSGDISLEELLEGVLHFAVYCGWPKGVLFDEVVHQQWARIHEERGIQVPARETTPLPPLEPADAAQRAAQSYMSVNAVSYVPPPTGPYVGAGVLGYVFGRMWTRPGLGVRARRLITLACVGVSDAHIPVQSHVYAAMASGDLTVEEVREVVLQFAAYAGWPKGSFLSVTVEQQYAAIEQGATGPVF